jgi:type VI secretion system secreted protein VgrG
VTREVKTGNEKHTIKTGNYTLDTSLGKVTVTAMQEIMLKVGGNSIKIDQSGITIKGIMVNIQGTATADIKSPLTTVKADAVLTLSGGVTMIN